MPLSRAEQIDLLANTQTIWDVVVIGGGASGLGIALDACTRGYKTLLVEQSDFAKGTSSRSTKLVHGGVRYLAQGDIALVREASHERGLLLHNAPHLVKDQIQYWLKAIRSHCWQTTFWLFHFHNKKRSLNGLTGYKNGRP